MSIVQPLTPDAIDTAAAHIGGILALAIEYTPGQSAVVVYDCQSSLSSALAAGYRQVLPQADFIDFDRHSPADILQAFAPLRPGDLVVLIQSTSFRLDALRIRIELFKRRLKVIEHPHLARMCGREALIYIDSLAYDPGYFRGVGHALKRRIDQAHGGIIDSAGELLSFTSPFEPARLNVGDYRQMKNVGGQFPIGEVFTEARDLEAVNGRVRIEFFGDTNFTVNRPPRPITLEVKSGRIVGTEGSTAEFDRVLDIIRSDEGEIWLRELGFGLNRAFSRNNVVCDIGTFERMCGVHLSLGGKHLSYRKKQINRKTARHHVDVFVCTESVTLDGETIFCEDNWQVDV